MIMAVPFLDIAAQYRELQVELDGALLDVARSGKYILADKVEGLEKRLATYIDVPHGVGCASGTDALILSLRALDIGPGDEVITTSYSFFSTASAIALVGATPVFVDIDPRTYNMNISEVEGKMNLNTKAIIPVHLFGQPAEMEPLIALSSEWGVKIIEDACQSIGAEYKGNRVCSLGDIGCMSFYPTKNLSCMGDGGMLFTRNAEIAKRMRQLRAHGAERKYFHKWIGYNSRLDEMQAAVLLVKEKHLEEWTEKRRANAHLYNEIFMGSDVVTPYVLPYVRHVYNQYVIRVRRRDELINFLKSKQIGCAVYYPMPLHLQDCFSYLGYKEGDMPEAERAAHGTLALPIYPELSQAQIQEVASSVLAFYRG
jgi:dTDP-4-amino-4,6-dideoxygalactose transaminase